MNESINNFSQRFNDSEIENEYLNQRWPKIWPYLKIFLFSTLLIKAFVMYDDINTFGPNIIYIIYHSIDLLGFFVFVFYLSDEKRKKFHQLYMGLIWVGFINIGAWIYYFSPFDFAPGEGIIISCIIIPLTIYPFYFLNGILAAFLTSIPMMIMLIDKGIMTLDQIPFLFIFPLIFTVFAKANIENRLRKDFIKSIKLESNKKLMHQTLKKYFGENLTEKILDNKGSLKGDNDWVTVSFTDISSYSTIIEHMSPELAVKFLNEYFTAMHEVIERYNGQIINYIGDCLMVVYGAPKKVDDHENLAIQCSIGMRTKLNELNEIWSQKAYSNYWKNHGIDKITARTGVHTGNVIVGNIGSDRMLQYSIIGDTVNVASRLEQVNKEFSTNIAFSEQVYFALSDDLHSKSVYLGEIKLKGRDTATKIYSI